jgi:hypothetical protein
VVTATLAARLPRRLRAGDDHLLELQRVTAQGEILSDLLTGLHGDAGGVGPEPEHPHHERVSARGNSGQRIATLRPGHGAYGRANEEDLCSGHTRPPFIQDPSVHDAGLGRVLRRRVARREEQHDQHGERKHERE